MTFTQRLFSRVFGPGVERESREWVIECPHCGHQDNVWDRGGVRYKARGTKWQFGRCSACGESGKLKIHRPHR
ncbi:MAG: hypothetical protein AAFO28_01755 [Pseudomonadota bacterium]